MNQPLHDDERPPILGNWQRLYGFVLLLHAVVIALFYWMMHSLS